MDNLKLVSLAKRFVLSVYILCFAGYAVSPLSMDLNVNKTGGSGLSANTKNSNSGASSDETVGLLVGDLIANKIHHHHLAHKKTVYILITKVRALINRILIQLRPVSALFAFLYIIALASAELLPVLRRKTKTRTGFRFTYSGLSPPPYFL